MLSIHGFQSCDQETKLLWFAFFYQQQVIKYDKILHQGQSLSFMFSKPQHPHGIGELSDHALEQFT